MADLQPLDVTIRPNDIRVPLNRIAAGAGTEAIFVGPPGGTAEIPGFRLSLPDEIVCARPSRESKASYDRRKRLWQRAERGVLLGSRTDTPVTSGLPQGVLEEGQCLWLVDVRLGETLIGRLGLVGTPDAPHTAERLERLNLLAELDLWRRVGDVWEHHLDEVWGPGAGHDPEAALRTRLDLLARELHRVLGVDGVGIHVWREDLGGYLLVGYHGPEMPRPAPGKLETRCSSWWFHRSGDPSLVHAVFPAERAGAPQEPLVWPGEGVPVNEAALGAFRKRHPGRPITSAVAAPLELAEHSLRGVVAVFVTGENAGPLDSLGRNWRRVHRSGDELPPSGRARLQAQALLAGRAFFQRAVEERYHLLLRRALAPAEARDRKARDPEVEAGTLLSALRHLAGAWSGALWEVDWPRRRRRPLALLHPLKGQDTGWQTLRKKTVPRNVIARRKPVLIRRRRKDRGWIAEINGEARFIEVGSSTARWLAELAPAGVSTSYSLSLPLLRAGECHAVLTLSWWYPPPGLKEDDPDRRDGSDTPPSSAEQLVRRLGPAVEAAAVHTGTLVVWRRERERNRLAREVTTLVDREVERAVGDIRGCLLGDPAERSGGTPLARLGEFVRQVCWDAQKLMGRGELLFYRIEDWRRVGGTPLKDGPPVIRQIAPRAEDDDLAELEDAVREDLLAAAKVAYSKGKIRPVEVLLEPSEGKAIEAVAFPCVVGNELVGLLVVPGTAVEIEPEQPLWLGVATALGRELELLRRQIYRFLDELADRELLRAVEGVGPGEHRAVAAARAGARLARGVTGAAWSVVFARDADGRLERLAGEGEPPMKPAQLEETFGTLSREWRSGDWGRCLGTSGALGREGSSGNPPLCSVFAAPLTAAGGLHGWLAVGAPEFWSRDGTRVVKAVARRLASALSAARAADRVYLAMASAQHGVRSAWQEVATGVGVVRDRLEELRMTDRELTEGLEQAEAGVRRARARMETLLYFSTSGLTATAAGGKTVNLPELVRQTVAAYRFAARDRDLELVADLPPVPVGVPGPPELVALVVENLVENAVKYAARRTRVTAAVALRGTAAVLRVVDTGARFPVERRAELERPFSRAASSGEGFGVGLAVVIDCCRRLGAQWEPFSRPLLEGKRKKALLHRVEMRVTFPPAGGRRGRT